MRYSLHKKSGDLILPNKSDLAIFISLHLHFKRIIVLRQDSTYGLTMHTL